MKAGLITESFRALGKKADLRDVAKTCFALPETNTANIGPKVYAPTAKVA